MPCAASTVVFVKPPSTAMAQSRPPQVQVLLSLSPAAQTHTPGTTQQQPLLASPPLAARARRPLTQPRALTCIPRKSKTLSHRVIPHPSLHHRAGTTATRLASRSNTSTSPGHGFAPSRRHTSEALPVPPYLSPCCQSSAADLPYTLRGWRGCAAAHDCSPSIIVRFPNANLGLTVALRASTPKTQVIMRTTAPLPREQIPSPLTGECPKGHYWLHRHSKELGGMGWGKITRSEGGSAEQHGWS